MENVNMEKEDAAEYRLVDTAIQKIKKMAVWNAGN